jgi:phenolic acid decarboxylase
MIENLISELGPRQCFNNPVVTVHEDAKSIEIMLEDVVYYAEWIEGEGGDISLYRAVDDNRVVGAWFPLRVYNGKICTDIITFP